MAGIYRELSKSISKIKKRSGAGIISQKLKGTIFLAELSWALYLEPLYYSTAVTSNQKKFESEEFAIWHLP